MIRDLILAGSDTGGPTPPSGDLNFLITPRVGDAAIVDKSGKSVPLTTNSVALDTTVEHFGNPTLKFTAGAASGLFVAAHILRLGTEPFTLEFWVRAETFSEAAVTLLDNRQGGIAVPFVINLNNTGAVDLYTGTSHLTVTGVVDPANFQHIAITIDSFRRMRCFVQGQDRLTSAFFGPPNLDPSPSVYRFGTPVDPSIYRFNGHIAEIRLTNNAVLYPDNFTPPTAPFPIP